MQVNKFSGVLKTKQELENLNYQLQNKNIIIKKKNF
jgi:hypothetical protein